MKTQNSSATSSNEVDNTVKALKKLRQQMTFLIALSPLERSHSRHVGPKNIEAAQLSLSAVREYPNILPVGFDLARFEQTVQIAAGLYQCQAALKELASDVQDTLLTVGAEAAKGTQQIRALVKAAAQTTPGLKQMSQRLAARSQRGTGAEFQAAPVESEPESPPALAASPTLPVPAAPAVIPSAPQSPDNKAA